MAWHMETIALTLHMRLHAVHCRLMHVCFLVPPPVVKKHCIPIVQPGFMFRHVTNHGSFNTSNERLELASEFTLDQYTCLCISSDIQAHSECLTVYAASAHAQV